MKHIKAIFGILAIFLVVVIIIQNHASMAKTVKFKINLIFFQYETSLMSLYLIVVIAFLVGIVVSYLLGISERFRLRKEIKALTKEAVEKDKELNSLRNLPVTSEDVSTNQTSDMQ